MQITLNESQKKFVYSQARHPVYIGSWSTGKTLCAILRARLYSLGIPNNLGVIFRRTERSLFDSTLKDFELYTQLKVNSHRNYIDNNDSITMFRHIDEIDDINKQNINLGWFYIEQGDELESDREFFMLFGRLRRKGVPTEEFLKLELPLRSGWVIGNAGDTWMKILFKEGKLENAVQRLTEIPPKFFELIETTYLENLENIPQDTISSWEVLKETKPEIYQRFVLNSWDVGEEEMTLIPGHYISELKNITFCERIQGNIISCDPSLGGDECVIYVMKNLYIIDKKYMHERDTMKIVGELILMSVKYDIDFFAVDAIGIGRGVVDRLRELKKKVIAVNSAGNAFDKKQFQNKRIEMGWYVRQLIFDKDLPYLNFEIDEELRKQLSTIKYKIINSTGLIGLESKQETKKRLGRSPDRADAFIYGIYHTQFADERNKLFVPYQYREMVLT